MAMVILIACMLLPVVSAESVLEVNMLVFESGSAAMEYKVNEGRALPYSNETGRYMLSVNDAAGTPLWSRNYELSFFKLSNPPRKAEYEIITEKFPYDSRMYEIALYKDNRILLRQYLDVCDYNGICGRKENAVSCASDCSISDLDGVCIAKDDNICDPDCVFDADCEKQEKEKKQAAALISIALSIIIVVLAVVLHRKRKKIIRLAEKAKAAYGRFVSELKEMGKPAGKGYKRR
ncbi:MAG: hypothetical protein PHO02_01340 [Candidatus Nanoarchaeia archaeon]|nr:hypothetical protein [Candidatus Nanoarchaeia archaeon]